MEKSKQFDPVERKQLRKDLNELYRRQANHIRLNGKPSKVIKEEIERKRNRLKIVDRKAVGHDYEDKPVKPRNPRRLKVSWYCSHPECENRILDGREKIMFKKRHYCSMDCALSDGGIVPLTMESKK
jgi:hypothetical protein